MSVRIQSIKVKLLAVQALLILAILGEGMWSAYDKRQMMLDGYQNSIRAVTESAVSIMKSYDQRAAKGEFSKEEAQKRAKDTLRSLRFFGPEYMFGYEYDGTNVIHGTMAEVEGTRKLADFKDSTGKLVIRELVNVARAGGGFVPYEFPKASGGAPLPKVGYALAYEPWGWIIGTGVYVDNVDAEFQTVLRNTLLIALLVSAVLGAISYRIASRVASDLGRITGATGRIAAGDLATTVEGMERGDEVGRLAQSVEALRKTAIEAAELRERQAAMQAQAAEERRQMMQSLAGDFERTVGGLIQSVSAAADELTRTSSKMSVGAEQTTGLVSSAAETAGHTSANVNAVAGATEELSASIREIARQVAESTTESSRAVHDVRRTYELIEQLDGTAKRTVEVVDLIRSIAAQTNLLALNATIEAARAGEAGKGFAVVASEVKNLANQTAKATDDVQSQIEAMTSATASVVQAMQGVGGVIEAVNAIASAISAAIEQQGAATREISSNVNEAAQGVAAVSGSLNQVCEQATETGSASAHVARAAHAMAEQSQRMQAEVARFLATVRAG
ncbi:methyl-accepting chemotaxis protein [Azospirillum thermophilum]|uniref:Chemotaxis protein n=1 Tax=Azospirillum thermophilum TaxID=2202148 RepID=A0A2S2CWZ6_9PROT|nr:cache domain-containing protein [Azospirillum thermophilum]AWK89043.1 chemotaxis protein [Azospirillum thermophilum]